MVNSIFHAGEYWFLKLLISEFPWVLVCQYHIYIFDPFLPSWFVAFHTALHLLRFFSGFGWKYFFAVLCPVSNLQAFASLRAVGGSLKAETNSSGSFSQCGDWNNTANIAAITFFVYYICMYAEDIRR